jgi:hypothetical protein
MWSLPFMFDGQNCAHSSHEDLALSRLNFSGHLNITGEGITVRGRGGPQGCETLRLPHCLDNRLTDGGEVVSLTRRPPLTQGRFLVLISGGG